MHSCVDNVASMAWGAWNLISTQVQGLPPRQAERGPRRGAARARGLFSSCGPCVEGFVGVRPREMARRLEEDPGGRVVGAPRSAANVVVARVQNGAWGGGGVVTGVVCIDHDDCRFAVPMGALSPKILVCLSRFR